MVGQVQMTTIFKPDWTAFADDDDDDSRDFSSVYFCLAYSPLSMIKIWKWADLLAQASLI